MRHSRYSVRLRASVVGSRRIACSDSVIARCVLVFGFVFLVSIIFLSRLSGLSCIFIFHLFPALSCLSSFVARFSGRFPEFLSFAL